MHRILTGLIALTLVSATATAQQFWEKKPWTQWNKTEVDKMLSESPWTQSQTLSKVNVQVISGSVSRPSISGALRDPMANAKDRDYSDVAKLKYTAQLRSAPLVRQALVRQLQLAKNYDGLSAEQKKNFDAKTAPFLEPGDPSQIVVHVGYDATVQGYNIELQRYWNAQTAQTLASSVYLNLPGGHKLSLADYSPATGGFQLLFQRPPGPLPEGNVTLQFASPAFENIPAADVIISFPTKKMLVDGSTVF
jgi:hypothetical protein